jgi:uncharacterized membrane protein YedE/YeeE
MTNRPLAFLAALVSGIVFGIGLAVARMIDPQKIKDFLDVAAIPTGGWDPSLAFVMGGGVIVFFVGYRLAQGRRQPIAASAFSYPERTRIDAPLVVGAAIFGIGWGISGFCPGPAIANLGIVPGDVVYSVAAMLVGSWITGAILEGRAWRPRLPSGANAA